LVAVPEYGDIERYTYHFDEHAQYVATHLALSRNPGYLAVYAFYGIELPTPMVEETVKAATPWG
jgi:hypothetical protein